VSEVVNLLQRELEFLVVPKPASEKMMYGVAPPKDPDAELRHVPYCARGVHRDDAIEVAPVVGLGQPSSDLRRIRLVHPRSIPIPTESLPADAQTGSWLLSRLERVCAAVEEDRLVAQVAVTHDRRHEIGHLTSGAETPDDT
jgi:hypothetical protein